MGAALKSDLKNRIKKIKSKGLPYLLKGLKRFFKGKNEVMDFYVLDLENQLSKLPEDAYREKIKSFGENFEIKILSPNDSAYYNEFIEFAKNRVILSDNYIESILKQSVRFVALLNKRIVAVTCLAFNEYPLYELEFGFMLGINQAYRFESFVDKEHRRKGIMSLLWDCEASFAMNKGCKYLVAAIRQWNKASYIPTLKMGFEKYATAILKERFFIERRKFIKLHNSNEKILSLRLFSGKVTEI